MSYASDREDFEYLETIAELYDQVDLDSLRETLMRNPTKAQAASMYQMGIRLWFGEHGDSYNDDEEVADIADRHDI